MNPVALETETNWISGVSPAMQMLENIVGELASTDIPVLLVGESGTGKEMLATESSTFDARSGASEKDTLRVG